MGKMSASTVSLPETDALPSICISPKCLNTAMSFDQYCADCFTRASIKRAQRKSAPVVKIDGDTWIYFIQQKTGGPINVGSTRNVKRRLYDLQSACPEELRLMACVRARPSLESDLSAMLDGERIRGRWFEETQLTQNLMHAARQKGATGVYEIVRDNCYLKE